MTRLYRKYLEPFSYVSNRHKESKKVVFTHGVFDLLHVGQLKTLKESKSFGDILIVGVDSDLLTKWNKGKDRPIISEKDRLTMVESIKSVDYAFILSPSITEMNELEGYISNIYELLKIDLVTSGNNSEYDFDLEHLCKNLGIEFRLAGGRFIETTGNIIKRIKGAKEVKLKYL